MKDCDTCGQSSVERQCSWLIEAANQTYWNGHHTDGRGFDRNVENAIRFTRQEDAAAVLHWLLEPWAWTLRTTLHCWINGTHNGR